MHEPMRYALVKQSQLVRFALVGCINVTVSFVIYVLCYRLLSGLAPSIAGTSSADLIANSVLVIQKESFAAALANLLGYAAGMVTSFMLNKTWTFEADGSTLRQFRRFLVLNLAGLLLSTVLIFIFVDRLGGPYIFVWIGTTCLVMVVNFVGNKFWTFSDSDPRKPIS